MQTPLPFILLWSHTPAYQLPHSPVFDILIRGDFELHARGTIDDQIVLGVRALLDLI